MSTLREAIKDYAPPAGRILMSVIFLLSAYGKITAFGPTAANMAAKGMPMTEALLVCAIAIEIAGATLLIVGWKTQWAALALIVFLVPATLYFHDYWNAPPAEVRNQRNHFMKNLTILGGLVFVIGMGAGPLSVDNRRRSVGRRAA